MKEIKLDLRIGSCLNVLQELPGNYFHTCVTSPPYWGLRDYGTGNWVGGDPKCPHMRTTKIGKTVETTTGHKAMHEQGSVVGDAIYKTTCPKCGATREDQQIGLEETPAEYITSLVEVFKQVWRVLRDDGTVWLNLGDSYYNYRPSLGQSMPKQTVSKTGQDLPQSNPRRANKINGLKEKDLVGIPWRVALALQEEGWYLRQDIIWHKPNPMPESVKDRCTKSHEYIFLLSKKPHYYFDSDAIKEEAVGERWGGNTPINKENSKDKDGVFSGLTRERQMLSETRNKRSVWSVCPSAYKEAHFAVFPEELITPCILSGSPEKACADCGKPYVNEPIYEYVTEIKANEVNHGKYETLENEANNRQGMHKKRGSKLVEVRENLPSQSEFIKFLRELTNAKLLAEASNIQLSKVEHWFRGDESGFAYPSIEDWATIRLILDDSSDKFLNIDKAFLDIKLKTDDINSKKIVGYELKKQCECITQDYEHGNVLDPFGGSGTIGLACKRHKRNVTLIELNPKYEKFIRSRYKEPVQDLLV